MGKNKKTLKQMAIAFAARAARNVANESNDWGWPPVCMGLFYQPKRPTRNPKLGQKEDDTSVQK